MTKKNKTTVWVIYDWAGNICFDGISFPDFEEGEYWLSVRLGDSYESDRGEYYIEPKDDRTGIRLPR